MKEIALSTLIPGLDMKRQMIPACHVDVTLCRGHTTAPGKEAPLTQNVGGAF